MHAPLDVAIEVENVGSESLMVLEPDVLPLITAAGYSGYPEDHGCNTVITAQHLSELYHLDVLRLARPGPRASLAFVLKSGQRVRMELHVLSKRLDDGEPIRQLLKPPKPDEGRRYVLRSPRRVMFREPGPDDYRLEATYNIDKKTLDGRDWKGWTGQIKSRPVLLEVTKE